ncbi:MULTISPECIES: twin-arginine translocase subunit TatC [Paenibacillus]|uniref:Sec-independent protein translocase protein TatC n=1 Tax=Paenibacillus vini TaxID=1476024 RepID=A0ABQ4MDP9_9BACL|nr:MULTISPECIES: twin-arginine translocase subunit TatC [Paenibacillus]MBQ4899230.1 twin-arginine translocase subunit TatC [Paenibacillus sp. Marseille-P2973]MDN4070622.1 twin-arginine translocase subunit TatC [Paenibacillus vini]GIP54054.1 Sec-independent protein translocase protein TatCy [Paenibacillus vini]
MAEQKDTQSVVDHLSELRRRLVYVLSVFVIVLVAAFFVVDPIYHYVTVNALSGVRIDLNAFSFWDGVGVYMKISMVVALGITLPFTLYQLWAFVSPGLKPAEQKATLRYIPFVFICFLAGLAFGYFVVFPLAMSFTGSLNKQLGLIETYGMADYFKFLMNIVLPISLLFELPLVILFLTQIRLLNPVRLKKMRRVAYFILVVISVMITPADFFSAFLVLIPLILLYELSVLLSKRVYRKQLAADAERELKYK